MPIKIKLLILVVLFPGSVDASIDRHGVVTRHNIKTGDISQILALGNGRFCFGVDGTGLQTVGGNIMADWAWHSFPLPEGATMADVPETGTIDTGPITGEMKHASAREDVSSWMFENPHKFSLGRFRFTDRNGKAFEANQIQNSYRTLDLWRGVQTTEFAINGKPVKVTTVVNPDLDAVSTRIESELLGEGELVIELGFPYPARNAGNELKQPWYGKWDRQADHHTQAVLLGDRADFLRKLDETTYHVSWQWSDPEAQFRMGTDSHTFRLSAAPGTKFLEFTCVFGPQLPGPVPGFLASRLAAGKSWEKYWLSGGAIDLSESMDPRWKELERRVVLSQYLMRTQSAGHWPPAEVSLMGMDFWSAQFHMEMIWWHLAHYGLWNRWELAAEALDCYNRFLPVARKLSQQFGYKGARWGKQVGPEGRTATWSHSFLLHWQQPHPVFFAELEYRLNPTPATLNKWKTIVFETADYMADFPVLKADGKYRLTPVCTANENGVGSNPVFESAYWRWALAKAQEWRLRLGLERDKTWDKVLSNLAPLPQAEGVYLFCDGWIDSYTKYNSGHPDPLGVCAFLPFVEGVDPATARRTVEKIDKEWQWANMWGWDYPWAAMAAARVGRPDLAVEMLLRDVRQNSYTLNGINAGWYFPGNGGLLYAVAMMTAGWDGAPDRNAPGFPGNGQWVVKWEGLRRAM